MISQQFLSKFDLLTVLVLLSTKTVVGERINLRGLTSSSGELKSQQYNNDQSIQRGKGKIRRLDYIESTDTEEEESSGKCGVCENGLCETIEFQYDGHHYAFNICVPCPEGSVLNSDDIDGKQKCVETDNGGISKSASSSFTSDDEWLGFSIANAGDINGDGIDDVIIGSPGNSDDPSIYQYRGAAYVLFGGASGPSSISFPDQLNGINGFAIIGEYINDRLGESVSGAGDINGDGIDDLIIGAPGADTYGTNDDGTSTFHGDSGAAYVIFGSSTNNFPSEINVADLTDCIGLKLHGKYLGDHFGRSVSRAGDINGDGIDDILVGAPRAEPVSTGNAYIFYGSTNIGDGVNWYASDLDGTNGFVIQGIHDTDHLGESVSTAGDVNGDGINDIIVGAPTSYGPNEQVSAGAAYVIFGAPSFEARLNVADLDGINNGFAIQGIQAYDLFGHSVSMAGDLNGDGYGDIIMSSPRHNSPGSMFGGEAYVIYGSSNMAASILAEEADIIITGTSFYDKLGSMVAYAGDVNGDGMDDVAITASYAAEDSAMVYILYGATSIVSRRINANELESLGAGAEIALLSNGDSNGDRVAVSSTGRDGGLMVGIPNLNIENLNNKIGEVKFFI